ncbi:MAG TPA: DNA primase [Candidatus Paceibacterota bacterium]|nr:DNA primase [Candidatus Paceibacterota bacterium]
MNSPVQKIKERLGVEEVISSYLKLEKAGANLKARCPFHNEKSPSFFVSPARESYYCFGCGAKGDIFTFVQEFEGLDFKGALKLLADRAGIPLSEFRAGMPDDSSLKEKLYSIMEEAAEYFEENLKHEKEALEYLEKRGLSEKTIKDFRIGFAKPEWRALKDHLSQKFSADELEKAGLIKKSEQNYYDRFRGRIMFPVCDSSGRVIAFSGRIFPPSDAEAKYLNSPETLIFKKSSVLYGIDKAKDSIRKNDFSIIVEGQFDLIMSHQAGFRNAVATLGTALSDSDESSDHQVNNLGIIKRLSQNIVFVFDSDKAGFAASMRAAGTALSLEMNVKASGTGDGKDPADLILEQGPEGWKKAIREAKHVIEFMLDKFVTSPAKADPLKVKMEVDEKILPYLYYITSPVKKSHFISVISHKTGIREEDIRESLKKKIVKEEKFETNSNPRVLARNFIRKDHILRRLLGIVLWQEGEEKSLIDSVSIKTELSRILGSPAEELFNEAKENAPDLIFEAEAFYGKDSDIKADTEEMLSNLEVEQLKAKLPEMMRRLEESETESVNNPRSAEILKEIGEINKRIQHIKSGRLK